MEDAECNISVKIYLSHSKFMLTPNFAGIGGMENDMIELVGKECGVIEPLIVGREDEVTLYACAEGHMGRVWVDQREKPVCAVVLAGDFYFILGDYQPMEIDPIIRIISEKRVYAIVLNDVIWSPLLHRLETDFPESYRSFHRFALDGRLEWFDPEQLKKNIKAIEPEYQVERIDERIYAITQENDWTLDFCSNLISLEEFMNHGIGYVIMQGDDIIAGASTYGYCAGRLEVTIETKEEYRRKGLALACASALILECLDRNIYPRWDAANMNSVALAEKLGYRFKQEYTVYRI